MHVFKRGAVYWFEFTLDGVRYRESTRLKDRRKATDIAATRRTEIVREDAGIVKRKRAPKFKAAMKSFLDWSEQEHKLTPNTADRYKYSSAALLRFFGDIRIDRITPEDAERFKNNSLGGNANSQRQGRSRAKERENSNSPRNGKSGTRLSPSNVQPRPQS